MRYTSIRSTLLLFAGITSASLFGQSVRGKAMEGSIHRAERRGDEAEPSRAIRRMARPSRSVSLRSLSGAESRPVTRKPGLTPVGVNRQLPEDVTARGEWSVSTEGKRVWRLTLESADAESLRVRFVDFHVGAGKVWLLGRDEVVTAGPYTADGLFGDGEFWSDAVAGESLILAYEPADQASDVVPFRPVAVSHRIRAAKAKAASAEDEPAVRLAAAASCALDVACYPEYTEPASAVALMVFESGGRTYQCSGSLVSSSSQPARPFFLTANHCISTQAEARSLIAYFNYQAPTCNGAPPSLGGLPRVIGATFLAGEPMSLGDFTLLQLSGFPNVDVKVLGWTADDIRANEQVTGISHPRGDYKRIAMGQRTRDVTIRFADGERMPATKGYQVSWFQGVTQGGSSGSPLLASINGREYLVGTLTAGPDIDEENDALVCRTSNMSGSYGRFSAAFSYIESFLTSIGGGSTPIGQSYITATPNPLVLAAGQTQGRATIRWQTGAATAVQIRVDSPDGPAMTGIEPPNGSAQTDTWVVNGMVFYLQDASSGDSSGSAKTLATVRVQVNSSSPHNGSGSITASPGVIVPSPGQITGATTLNWRATGVSSVQIRVNSSAGTPLTGIVEPTGSVLTGNWVRDGMVFYLQDASDGSSSGPSRTLATVRVRVAR